MAPIRFRPADLWVGLTRPRGSRGPVLSRLLLLCALTVVCVIALTQRLPLIAHDHDVGHADSASYVLQGRMLAEAGTARVPYVSTFFRIYPADIHRYEDHWPPLLGWILAGAFRTFGTTPHVAHVVTLVFGALLLPLAAAWLAFVLSRSSVASLITAFLMLANGVALRQSTIILCDVPLAALLAAFAAGVVSARQHPAWFMAAAICGALAFYCKGSEIILLPLLPLLAVCVRGWRVLRDRWLHAALGIFVVLVLPWWITMAASYGNPFHSTQNYVSAFYGLEDDWDAEFYRVYWDENLPRTTDRFDDLDALEQSVRRNLEVYARKLLLGSSAGRQQWEDAGAWGPRLQASLQPESAAGTSDSLPFIAPLHRWPEPWLSVVHLVALLVGVAGLVLRLFGARFRRLARFLARNEAEPAAAVPELTGIAGGVVALVILIVVHAGLVIVMWRAQTRFALALFPLLAAMGCLPLRLLALPVERWLRRLAERSPFALLRRPGWLLSLLACGLPLLVWTANAAEIHHWVTRHPRTRAHVTDHYPRAHAVATSLAGVVPDDAVIMLRHPWEVLCYGPITRRAVGLPYGRPDVVFAVARYYGVTHLILDCDRPGLRSFLEGGHPALTQVVAEPFGVYAIDWSRFDDDELSPLPPPEPSGR